MKLFLRLQLILLLVFLTNIQSTPTRELTDDDWNTLLELMRKSNKMPTSDNEYYESFNLKPIIVKMDSEDNFNFGNKFRKLNKKDNTVSLAKDPKETKFWTSVESFFTNDLKKFATNVADNYNPIPPIVSGIDNVKRSNTWIDFTSFFTNGYDRLAKMSENVLDNLKNTLNDE